MRREPEAIGLVAQGVRLGCVRVAALGAAERNPPSGVLPPPGVAPYTRGSKLKGWAAQP